MTYKIYQMKDECIHLLKFVDDATGEIRWSTWENHTKHEEAGYTSEEIWYRAMTDEEFKYFYDNLKVEMTPFGLKMTLPNGDSYIISKESLERRGWK